MLGAEHPHTQRTVDALAELERAAAQKQHGGGHAAAGDAAGEGSGEAGGKERRWTGWLSKLSRRK